jgi:DNA-binding CsgD family transcriptional regulator
MCLAVNQHGNLSADAPKKAALPDFRFDFFQGRASAGLGIVVQNGTDGYPRINGFLPCLGSALCRGRQTKHESCQKAGHKGPYRSFFPVNNPLFHHCFLLSTACGRLGYFVYTENSHGTFVQIFISVLSYYMMYNAVTRKKMIPLLFFCLYIILAVFQFLWVSRLEKKYALSFLPLFRNYLLSFYIYAFVKYMGYLLLFLFLPGQEFTLELETLLSFLAVPFFFGFLYFLFLWIRELVQKNTPPVFKIVYWSFQSGVFLVYPFGLFVLNESSLVLGFLRFLYFVEVGILLGALVQIFPLSRSLNREKRGFARRLGFLFLLIHGFLELAKNVDVSPFPADGLHYSLYLGGLCFGLSLFPLVFLAWFLSKKHAVLIEVQQNGEGLDRFCAAYQITSREREVISLVMKGKNNREIAEALFISVQTVKNTIYNIFRKTRIKNRIQLLNLIRSYPEGNRISG